MGQLLKQLYKADKVRSGLYLEIFKLRLIPSHSLIVRREACGVLHTGKKK